MKHSLRTIVIFVLFCLICTACAATPTANPVGAVVEQTDYYKITELDERVYEYRLYNAEGEEIYRDVTERLPPRIYAVGDKYTAVEIGAGTDLRYTMVCEPETGRLSEWFEGVRLISNGIIVRMSYLENEKKAVLEVRDIFDESIYCERFERDFSPIAAIGGILENAELVNENLLRVEYYIGDGFELVSEDIMLRQPPEDERHPIDVDFENAMNEWSGRTQEGVDIFVEYGDKWKAEMETYLNLLTEELDDGKKQWVASSQEAWEVFTKENEELAWQTYDQMYSTGSIMHIITANIYYDKYRTRALELKTLYDELTFTH